MDEAELYLRTIEDLGTKLGSGDLYVLLRASALLRQLLIDGTPLVHLANRPFKIKLQFRVVQYVQAPIPSDIALQDVGADHGPAWAPLPQLLNFDQFLAAKCMAMGENVFSVHDVIDTCAHVLSGVHLAPPKPDQKPLLDFDNMVQIGGLQASVSMLSGIVRTTLKGLEPLTEAVRQARASH